MSRLFPIHLRTIPDGLDFLWDWPWQLGGHIIGRPDIRPGLGGKLTIADLHIGWAPTDPRLSVSLTLAPDLDAPYYRFDFRRDGVLLWRADCHPGHEEEFGGPHHLHLGPTEHARVASPAYSLQDIAVLIHETGV